MADDWRRPIAARPRAWVLGSAHPSADRSIAWDDPFPNFSDPDVLIVDLTTLTVPVLEGMDGQKLAEARQSIMDKYYSRGIVVVITQPNFSVSKEGSARTNYSMLPIELQTKKVPAGSVITWGSHEIFRAYRPHVEHFSFHIESHEPRLTRPPLATLKNFELFVPPGLEIQDRSQHYLGAMLTVSEWDDAERRSSVDEMGQLVLLPPPTGPVRDAIGSILSVYGKAAPAGRPGARVARREQAAGPAAAKNEALAGRRPPALARAGGSGSGTSATMLVRLRMYWRLLAGILDAHYGELLVAGDAGLNAEYLRVCLDAERLLDDPSLADLRALYERPVDSLLSGAVDADWNHEIRQRCGLFLREVERRVVLANADDGLLADDDLEYRRRVTGLLGRHLSSKDSAEQACLDAAREAAEEPGGLPVADSGGGKAPGAPGPGEPGVAAPISPVGPPAPGGYAHDVFLSYSHETKDSVARPLAEGLVRRGVTVWWDQSAVGIGDNLPQKIRDGLARARHCVAIVSKGYLGSAWGRTELGAMFGASRKIFPILYGVSPAEAKRELPPISETLMRKWEDMPDPIVDEIAGAVRAGRGAGGSGGGRGKDGGGRPNWEEPLVRASRGSIDGIAKTILGSTIERRGELAKVERLLEEHGRVVVTGDKGSGKSVLLCQVHESLAGSRNTAFVKADDFLGIDSFSKLDRAIAPGRSFTDLVRAAARGPRGAVVIVDSLDSVARDKKTMAAFRQLVKEAWGAGASTIVTVRSYDYRYSESISATDWGAEYNLGPLSDNQVAHVMSSLGDPRVSGELEPLLANPLNLHIFSLVVKDSGGEKDFTSIRHEIGLYDAHWRRYVELGPSPGRVTRLLCGAALTMAKDGTTAVPAGRLGDEHARGLALSANVLRPVRSTGRVAFFHHAYLDYVLSRAVLEGRSGIVGFLKQDEHNLFARPALPLTLEMARDRDARGFVETVSEMLRSNLKHYWKTAAAAALARVDGGDAAGYGGIGRLLTGLPMLQRHFLFEAAERKNAFWLGAWGGSFLEEWASDKGNPNGAFLAAYAAAAAAAAVARAGPDSHARAFALLRLVAENNRQNGTARQQAVSLMAEIDAPGRGAWLKAASGSADVRKRTGVARMLPGLLQTDPGAVPDMFASLFAYEETSGKPTVLADAGSTRFTSTLAQGNAMIKWTLEKEFPGMLRERPDVMIGAAIRAAERAQAAASPPRGAGPLVDAGPETLLHALMPQQPADAVIPTIRAHLKACSDAEFDGLAPLLADSRLGVFRSMLVDGLAGRGDAYLERLVDELSDPRAYELHTMRASVKRAIGLAAGRLAGDQPSRVLKAIMSSNRPEDALKSADRDESLLRAQLLADTPDGMFTTEEVDNMLAALGQQQSPGDKLESAKLRSGRARAQFLAEFPEEMLGVDHLELVRAHRPRAGDEAGFDRPPLPQDMSFHEMPDREKPVQGTREAILAGIGKRQDREGRIALLESISEYLDGRGDALVGDGLLPRIEQCLLESARDPDPDSDAEDEPGAPIADYLSVRGLAALCLAKMAALRGGKEVEDALCALSGDPSNLVRGGVARGLAYLLPCCYDLAYPILLEYSRDPDPRVRLFLGDRLNVVLNRDPAQASAVVESVLAAGGPPMPGTASSLLWLALKKKEPRASSLLDRVAGDDKLHDVRIDIPFELQPYLSRPDHRDAALALLLKLIEAGPADMRAKAAFFAFNGADDDGGRDYPGRVAPHLDLLASLFGSGQLDLPTAEYTVQFLESHWGAVPGEALSCLEAIARRTGTAHQPVLAQSTAKIISGMIERYAPGEGEWGRCLDILDVYATAGWPEIRELLAAMERPD